MAMVGHSTIRAHAMGLGKALVGERIAQAWHAFVPRATEQLTLREVAGLDAGAAEWPRFVASKANAAEGVIIIPAG